MSASLRRRWSPTGLATAVVMAAWAGMLWFLMASGRWALYLSPRTYWVVPLGAATLTAGAIGRLATARVREPAPLRRREAWGLALIALPVITVLALPPSSLGSYAASRRSSIAGIGFVPVGDLSSGPVTFVDVAAAQNDPQVMNQLVRRAGSTVTFTGLVVVPPDTPADEFTLTNFLITCCLEDALVAQVRVVDVTPGQFHGDQWVQVTGQLFPAGQQVILAANKIVAIPRPSRPYLSP